MNAIEALLLFAAWTLLLVVGVFLYRGVRVLGGTAINAWPRGNKTANDAAFVTRIADAHANCLENLVPFAVIVLGAAAAGKTAVLGMLPAYVLYARLGQSIAHLIGTSVPLVMIRATFWAAQLVLFGLMLAKLLS